MQALFKETIEDESSEMALKDLHNKIVDKILPQCAERLRKQGVISAYDREYFKIQPVKEWARVEIRPDLVLHLPDKRKVLIEIANPEKPKRFIGELVYPHILGHHDEIGAAILFILQRYPEEDQVHERGFVERALLDQIIKHKIRIIGISLYDHEPGDVIYKTLKHFLEQKELLFSIGLPSSSTPDNL